MSNAKCHTKEKFPLPNKIKVFFLIHMSNADFYCMQINQGHWVFNSGSSSSISDSQGHLGVVVKLTDRVKKIHKQLNEPFLKLDLEFANMPSANISLTRTQCNGPTYNSRLRNMFSLGCVKEKEHRQRMVSIILCHWPGSFLIFICSPQIQYLLSFIKGGNQRPIQLLHLVQRPRALASVFIYIRGKSCVYELIASYLTTPPPSAHVHIQ